MVLRTKKKPHRLIEIQRLRKLKKKKKIQNNKLIN